MDHLFDGLEEFGMGSISKNVNLFEDEEKDKATRQEEEVDQEHHLVPPEDVFIYDKNITCPVCGIVFKSKIVKTGKAKLLSTDSDLRPIYEGIDVVKYDAIVCTHCGYASFEKNFKEVSEYQIKEIREKISADFKGMPHTAGIYTYKNAIDRTKMVLLNDAVRHSKISEKAYACLKLAWLYRGLAEKLDKNIAEYDRCIEKLLEEEVGFIHKAYEGFFKAIQKESLPICGMDSVTINYLLAELGRRCKDYDNAMHFVNYVISSRGVTSARKEKARVLRDIIREEMESVSE